MKYIILFLVLMSSQVFACWNVKATLSVNGKEIKVDQKLDHDKMYSFPSGPYIFNMKIASQDKQPASVPKVEGAHYIEIAVVEKVGAQLKAVSNGQMIVKSNQPATLTKKNPDSSDTTTFTILLTEI